MNHNYLIVGSGFAGSVIAERLSQNANNKILVMEERSHIGGNCYTHKDPVSGITVHKYGPHIFNTNNAAVWDYVGKFCEMMPFINRVKAVYQGRVYAMPINLHTINQFFSQCLSPDEAKDFLKKKSVPIEVPENFEQQALSFVGYELYKAFFYGYTRKQWGCDPAMLPAEIIKRLPVRFNYDDNYYSSVYQGIPKDGYTSIFERMLHRENIVCQLNSHFSIEDLPLNKFDHIFYTGPIDQFFNFKYGRLGYRTVYFEQGEALGDFQGNAVINYTDAEIPYTRIHEHKHFTPWEKHRETIYFKEFSKEWAEGDIPFYPKRLQTDRNLFEKYWKEGQGYPQITFLGRLATYRYLNMDKVIEESLDVADSFLSKK